MASGQIEAPSTLPGPCSSRTEQVPAASLTQQGTDSELLRRFVCSRDENAFRVIVERYGPIVLAVCRRILGNGHDAEDAFQATFLVLARKAPDLARPELLKNWLYGVAHRVARKARTQDARRAQCEKRAVPKSEAREDADPGWQEAQEILDEEVEQLPEKYRVPLVLCYLQGNTHQEAARQLGCPIGSVSWLLHQGREKLRQRLTQRGLSFASGLTTPLLFLFNENSEMPRQLIESTARFARIYASGAPAFGLIPTAVSQLARLFSCEQTVRSWRLFKGLALALATASVLTALLLWYGRKEQPRPAPSRPSHPCGTHGPCGLKK